MRCELRGTENECVCELPGLVAPSRLTFLPSGQWSQRSLTLLRKEGGREERTGEGSKKRGDAAREKDSGEREAPQTTKQPKLKSESHKSCSLARRALNHINCPACVGRAGSDCSCHPKYCSMKIEDDQRREMCLDKNGLCLCALLHAHSSQIGLTRDRDHM